MQHLGTSSVLSNFFESSGKFFIKSFLQFAHYHGKEILPGSCNVVEDSSTVICIHHSGWNEVWVCFKVITICRWIPQYHANTTSFSNNCALLYTCSDTPHTSNYLAFYFRWVKSAIEAQVAAIIFHIGNLHQIHSITNNTPKLHPAA